MARYFKLENVPRAVVGGPALITDVRCAGFENFLIDCFYRVTTSRDDDHSYDVGVVCNTEGYFGELESSSWCGGISPRLPPLGPSNPTGVTRWVGFSDPI